jgi:hypothetical protein
MFRLLAAADMANHWRDIHETPVGAQTSIYFSRIFEKKRPAAKAGNLEAL